MKLERDLMKQIEIALVTSKLTGEIVYYSRVNSGNIKTYYGSYVKLADKGHPDYVVVIRDKSNGLSLLFVEAKSETGKLSPDQIKFRDKYVDAPNIYYHVCRDIKQLNKLISSIAIDTMSEIKI